MHTNIEIISDLERKMNVTVPVEQMESKIEARLNELRQKARLDGFRPGKVPLREVRRRFGESVRQEISNELIQSSFQEAFEQKEVEFAGTPRIEDVKLEVGQDLEYTVIFEVLPEIELGDFSRIDVEKPNVDVSDQDIDDMIEKLRRERIEYTEVDRVAAQGDKVNLDIESIIEGKPPENNKDSEVILGSGRMIPGFEEGLTGCKAGDHKDLELTFPQVYPREDLAGKGVLFKTLINTVSEPLWPELDDEFFQSFGVSEGGMTAFRDGIRNNLIRESGNAIERKLRNQVMDCLVDTVDVQVPKGMLGEEVDRMKAEASQMLGRHDHNHDHNHDHDLPELPTAMFEKNAIRMVKSRLIFDSIVKKYNIEVSNHRIHETITEMASSYDDPEEVIRYTYSNDQNLKQIENMVLEKQVVDLVLQQANVTDVEMTCDEILNPASEQSNSEPSEE